MQQDIPCVDEPFRPFQRGENLAGLHGIYTQFGFFDFCQMPERHTGRRGFKPRPRGVPCVRGLELCVYAAAMRLPERRTGRRGFKPRLRGMAL